MHQRLSRTARILSGAGLLVGVLAFATTPHAADVKVLPGSSCQPTNSGTVGITQFATALANGSGQTVSVTCPLLRDVHNSVTGLVDLDVLVQSSATVTCNAFSISGVNSVLRSVVRTGNGALDFGNTLGGLGASENSVGTGVIRTGSTNALICTLGPGDVIQNIRYDE